MTRAGRDGSEITTIRAAWAEFRRKRGPWVIGGAILLAIVVRAVLGPPGWADAGAAIYILVAYPFGEWAIHVHLLHLRPFDFRGRRIELATAQAHRAHHEDPRSLDLINFSPVEALAVLLLAVPAAAGLADGVLAMLGGRLAARPLVTMLVTGFLMVGVYEWTHFLIHTGHRPGRPTTGRSGATTASITTRTSTTGTGSPTRSQTGSSARARTRPRSPGRRRREPSTASRSPSVRAEHVDENG